MEQSQATCFASGRWKPRNSEAIPPKAGVNILRERCNRHGKTAIRNCARLPCWTIACLLIMKMHSPGNKEGWPTFSHFHQLINFHSGVIATSQPGCLAVMEQGNRWPGAINPVHLTHIRHLPNSPPLQLQPPATLGQVVLWSNRGLSPCNAIALKRPLPRRLADGLPDNHR